MASIALQHLSPPSTLLVNVHCSCASAQDLSTRKTDALPMPCSVALFARRVDVRPGPVAVRELGYHWASCGPSGSLNFHSRIMLAPATVIDYVVAHELCHLKHRDHSVAFWNEVDKVLPSWRTKKDWLRRCGAGLDL